LSLRSAVPPIGIFWFLQLIKDELLPEKWKERLRLLNLLPPRPWYIWVILLLVIALVGGLEGVVRISTTAGSDR
jgi:hypothetical protein